MKFWAKYGQQLTACRKAVIQPFTEDSGSLLETQDKPLNDSVQSPSSPWIPISLLSEVSELRDEDDTLT